METNKQPGSEPEVGFDPKSLIGITLGDRYEIVKQIGRGGMGVVYLARQSNLSRDVVIKVLSPDLVDDKAALARFEREARGLSRLQHPNIVTIFDFGRDAAHAFIAMEYVSGQTLSRYLRKKKAPLTLPDFAPIAVQILKGIGEAHKLGLIHRDIKPTNIMLCELEGQPNFVKILDFGLAKLVRSTESVTKDQHLVGSAAFLSPEQILNGEFTSQSDVYAIGVLFYLMLCGKRPFNAENDAVLLYKHVNEEPVPLESRLPENNDIPPSVIRLVERCLSKDPEQRPADANAVLAALQGTLSSNLTRVPWASGEFTPVGLIEGPTSLHLNSQMLPAAPDDSPTPSGMGNADTYNSLDLSGISKQITGQSQVIMVQQGPSRKSMVVILLAVAVIATVAAVVTVNMVGKEDPAAVAEDPADHDALVASLDRVDELIAEGKWGKAGGMLDSVSNDINEFPELVERSADAREQIEIGQLLVKARTLRDGGDTVEAISTYESILARDPGEQTARAELQTLRDSATAANLAGTVSVTGTPGATLYVNGEQDTTLPATIDLPPGKHSIEVRKDGYETWSRDVEVVAAGTHSLDAPLLRAATSTVTAAKSKKKGSSKKKRSTDKKKDTGATTAAVDTTEQEAAQAAAAAEKLRAEAAEAKAKQEKEAAAQKKKDEEKKRKEGLLLPVGDKDKKKEGLLLPVGGK